MHDRDEVELTAVEREAFDALPREAMPSRMLEERIVTDLRARGLLGARRPARVPWNWGRVPIAAAAAGIALFATGLALGQWLGARHTADAMLKLQRQDSASAAAAVQRTGEAYLSALGALAQASASSDPGEIARARQAAQSVFHEAANEMVRLSPDDPMSAGILTGMERAKVQAAPASANGKQTVVAWK